MRSSSAPAVARVVVVVLDGLRPDAIETFGLNHIHHACVTGAHTLTAQTVAPSVTACAMTSLFTGASPELHGMQSDKFGIPRPRGTIHPMPKMLGHYGLPSSAHLEQVPFLFRGLARKFGKILGLRDAGFYRDGCRGVMAGAREAIKRQDKGLVLMHWPDADRTGHAHGWMSSPYGEAARRMNTAFGELTALLAESKRDDTLLIALADHGGGGAKRDDHNSSHPLDRTIPVILNGAAIESGPLTGPVSLLDVPATVLWALGVPRPASYAGRPIIEAFTQALAAA